MEQEWVNVAQACEIYGCTDSQIYRLVKRGVLGTVREERLDRRRVRFWLLRSAIEAARPKPVEIQAGDWVPLSHAAESLGLTYGAIRKRVMRGEIEAAPWYVVPPEQRVQGERLQRSYIERAEMQRFASSLYHVQIGTLPTHHTLIDLVYAASFIDGEGCIQLAVTRHKGATYHHPLIKATNTHEGVIRWLGETFGGRIYERPGTRPHHRRQWHWCIDSGKAYQFLMLLRPYFKIKDQQAELVIEYYERLRALNGDHRRSLPPEERQWRDQIAARIHHLNSGCRP